MREWRRRIEVYNAYFKIIAPFLPASARRFWRLSLHDGKVQSVSFAKTCIHFDLDARHAFHLSDKYSHKLTFRGVKGYRGPKRLQGRWWLYDEMHLCSSAPFSFHVMFDKGEIQIDAANEVLVSTRR